MPDLWEHECAAWAQGYETVCGVDEAGAGPLMGPVYAAAVILPRGCVIDGLNDSKKLTPKKRDALYDVIIAEAEAWAVASVSAAEIDATDILSARMKAMQLAIDALAVRADRRQPRPRQKCRRDRAARLHHRRRRLLGIYRGGIHPREGQP